MRVRAAVGVVARFFLGAGMWARALAGIVAGFFLAAGGVGVVAWCWPGPWQATLVASALAFFPAWMLAATASFLFADGKRAWLWLGAAAAAAFGVLWLAQRLQWVV